MNKQIGKITKKIIKILELEYAEEKPIFIGEANLEHMQEKHSNDFAKYCNCIEEIIRSQTYLAKNDKKQSIEFVKQYENEFVLIAIRNSTKNVLFARTMYVMDDEKVRKYFKHKYFYKF